MKPYVLLFLIVVFSTSINCWFGSSEAETTTTTTTAPSSEATSEQPAAEKKSDEPVAEKTESEKDEKLATEKPQTDDDKPAVAKDVNLSENETIERDEESELDSIDLYMFTAKDMADNDFSLEAYRGLVTLVVNVASKCGYTDSTYKDLVTLQTKFEPTGYFTVLAFPCNQFMEQEPGTNEEIFKFATETYNINFPVFAKTEVTGDNASDTWMYLAQVTGYAPQWNFWKYLVDQNGRVIDVWSHETPAIELEGWIEDAISKAIAQAEGGEGYYSDYDTGEDGEAMHEHDHGEL